MHAQLLTCVYLYTDMYVPSFSHTHYPSVPPLSLSLSLTYTHTYTCTHTLYPPSPSLSSEFELPWFDLDAREEKESVRTTRSKARTARQSIGSSGGRAIHAQNM